MSFTPSPDLVGLLGELSQQQERTVLAAGAYGRKLGEPISTRTAGLSNLERELLRVHREEAAYLLNYLSFFFGYQEQGSFMRLSPWRSPGERIYVRTEGFAEHARRTLDRSFPLPSAVQDLLLSGLGGKADMSRASGLSLQLVESGYGHLQLSLGVMLAAKIDFGLTHARTAAAIAVKADHIRAANAAVGIANLLCSSYQAAWDEGLSKVAFLESAAPPDLAFSLVAAVAAREPGAAAEVAAKIDHGMGPDHPFIKRFLASFGRPGTAHRKIVRALGLEAHAGDPEGTASQRIISALSGPRRAAQVLVEGGPYNSGPSGLGKSREYDRAGGQKLVLSL